MADLTSQPDEGYSEDPLSGSSEFPSHLFNKHREEGVAALGTARSAFPAWFTRHIAGLSVADKTALTMAILSDLPTGVVMKIVEELAPRLYINFIRYLPPEICLKILGYLDPLSLVNFSKACKEWYGFAFDRTLWEHLYYMEGWSAKPREIKSSEMRMNAISVSSSQRRQSDEHGPPHKKRVVSVSPGERDGDLMMIDADGTIKQEPADMEMTGVSLFGDGGSSSTSARTTGISQRLSDLDMRSSSSSSRKVKELDKGKGRASLSMTHSSERPNLSSGLLKSTLWMWDEASKQYKINWKYLYAMRRRLESNWELGKFTNFQFPLPEHPEEGHGECIYTLQYNADYLVTGSRDRTIKIWDMRTRRCLRTLAKHTGSVLSLQFDSDPAEDIIVSGSSDSDVIIWRFSTGEVLRVLNDAHEQSVLNVKFDNRILVTASRDKTLAIFNRKPLRYGDVGYPASTVEPLTQHGSKGNMPLGPDDYPVIPPWTEIGRLVGHQAAVNTLQIHENEVVSASGDRHIKVWDWTNSTCIRTIVGHSKGIACVLYDGRRIVSGSSDEDVKIFDRQTGLEVASLSGHGKLVRTVQAGFGDLPYSKEEDEAEAKRVDKEYFHALASGRIEEPDRNSGRRPARRQANAGSRRPEDICAYGAKLPPGGGGGKYGRIVSGSYDASIIIWRRDKEGVWKAQHRLRQEDAAIAARSQARASLGAGRIPLRQPNQLPVPGPHGGPPTAGSSVIQPPANPMVAALNPQGQSSMTEATGPASMDAIRQVIEQAVQGGQQAFVRALATRPEILGHRNFVETVIDSQFSPVVRSQLRQAFSAALIRAQFEQARSRREAMRAQEDMATPVTGSSAGPSNATTQTQARHGSTETADAASATATTRPTPATAVPVTSPTAAQMAAAASAHQLHAQLARAPENGVRIHQLQFDAHQVIACSQSSVVLGWDFCNGDPELIEASRFFDTVQ